MLFFQNLPLEMCASVVSLALSNPEVEPPDDSEEREKDRQICMASQVHQVVIKKSNINIYQARMCE